MLFYFVFHFLRNYNDVYVMYCLPVGCNNKKKYELQKLRLAVVLQWISCKTKDKSIVTVGDMDVNWSGTAVTHPVGKSHTVLWDIKYQATLISLYFDKAMWNRCSNLCANIHGKKWFCIIQTSSKVNIWNDHLYLWATKLWKSALLLKTIIELRCSNHFSGHVYKS